MVQGLKQVTAISENTSSFYVMVYRTFSSLLSSAMPSRQQLRTEIRRRRMALTVSDQLQAATALVQQVLQQPVLMAKQHFALYLSNDGEINTAPLIAALRAAGKTLYLPVLHPFAAGYLLFQQYQPATPLHANRFGIAEPELNCADIKPVAELDVIFTPLVAFDSRGQRLGMGGGFYDRTLAQLAANHNASIIGLAHSCQQVAQVPVEPWDQPLHAIITPAHYYRFQP